MVANFQALGIFCVSSVRPRQNSRNGKTAVQVREPTCAESSPIPPAWGNKSYCQIRLSATQSARASGPLSWIQERRFLSAPIERQPGASLQLRHVLCRQGCRPEVLGRLVRCPGSWSPASGSSRASKRRVTPANSPRREWLDAAISSPFKRFASAIRAE